MLKPQDVVILLKLLADPTYLWSQNQLALHLCMSVSEVNAGLKRLDKSELLILRMQAIFKHKTQKAKKFLSLNMKDSHLQKLKRSPAREMSYYGPILPACEEFLITAVKYFFPVQLGEPTRGIPTSYAAPVFEKKIILGKDPIPVWPYAEGKERGLTLEPLYSSVPKSITQYPDQSFYDLLALIDAIRQGRIRERNLATKILKERLKHAGE